jgi:hypothetical protein
MLSSGYAILYQKGIHYVHRAIFYLNKHKENNMNPSWSRGADVGAGRSGRKLPTASRPHGGVGERGEGSPMLPLHSSPPQTSLPPPPTAAYIANII